MEKKIEKEKRYDRDNLLSPYRMGAGDKNETPYTKPFHSDRNRILYCSAFRRLQQKAQVFSLETNSNVRSRLTHSLEVANLGRELADHIARSLVNRRYMTEANIPVVVSIVENSCLLHDIGNPPFGHFGESAIQDWTRNRARSALPEDMSWTDSLAGLMKDFEQFDGNPQGFRTVTKLFTDFGPNGLDLTFGTQLCSLKYARTTSEPEGDGIRKKAGYFQTEAEQVAKIWEKTKRQRGTRSPLTYIMEAADDIAYCMSDIADGIEKRILTEEAFVQTFAELWQRDYGVDNEKGNRVRPLPREIEKYLSVPGRKRQPEKMRGFNHDFSIHWSRQATEEAVKIFMDDHEAIFRGEALGLFDMKRPEDTIPDIACVLDTIRNVCIKLLYPSIEAENLELTGYAVITGILIRYERLLKLTWEDYADMVSGKNRDLIMQQRLFHRFPQGYVDAYNTVVNNLNPAKKEDREREWWLRVHLLIDHISSMTDAYALETYQMLEGIALMKT